MTPIIDKTQEVIMALPHAPVVYQRARHLCIIARGVKPPQWLSRPKDMPVIVEATKAHLMELASKAAKWWKFDKRTQSHEPALPPAWAIEALLSTWTKVLPQFTLLENQSCISFQTVGESLGRVPIFPVNR